MKPFYLIFISLFLASSIKLMAQEDREFGDLIIQDFSFPPSIADTTAAAVILLDKGLTTYDQKFSPTMTNHVRILILKNSELDRANIKIPHRKSVKVKDIKACAYNLVNGEIVKSEVGKKDIYTEKVSDEIEQDIFTIPNVKPGSIIEYTYNVGYGSLSSLNTWYFQTSVPVLYSKYTVSMPEFYSYKQRLTGYIPLADFKQEIKSGYYHGSRFNVVEKTFVAVNVPAWEDEPFISSKQNYISKIDFDLSHFRYPGGERVDVTPPSYGKLIEEMEKDPYYSGIYKFNGYLKSDLDQIIEKDANPLENIKKIYEFVQSEYKIDTEIMSTNLRRIYKERKGWRQDINMILAAMYNQAGFEAHIVRSSTKSHGYINRNYPTHKNFNYSLCMVRLADNFYILDATEKNLPFNTLRPSTVNDQGLIISSMYNRWIDLEYGEAKKVNGLSDFTIEPDGSIHGLVKLQHLGYSKINFENKYPDKNEYLEEFQERNFNLNLIEHEVDLDDPQKLEEKIDFVMNNSVSVVDNLIIFNPIFLDRIKDNPFKLDHRNYPVTLDAPIQQRHTYQIKIPSEYEVTDLPESLAISLPNNDGKFLFSCQQISDKIVINSVFSITKTYFDVSEYYYLKEFYAQIIEKQSEEIIIKMKKS